MKAQLLVFRKGVGGADSWRLVECLVVDDSVCPEVLGKTNSGERYCKWSWNRRAGRCGCVLYYQNLMLSGLFRENLWSSVQCQILAVDFEDVEQLGLDVGLGMVLLSTLRY